MVRHCGSHTVAQTLSGSHREGCIRPGYLQDKQHALCFKAHRETCPHTPTLSGLGGGGCSVGSKENELNSSVSSRRCKLQTSWRGRQAVPTAWPALCWASVPYHTTVSSETTDPHRRYYAVSPAWKPGHPLNIWPQVHY